MKMSGSDEKKNEQQFFDKTFIKLGSFWTFQAASSKMNKKVRGSCEVVFLLIVLLL